MARFHDDLLTRTGSTMKVQFAPEGLDSAANSTTLMTEARMQVPLSQPNDKC